MVLGQSWGLGQGKEEHLESLWAGGLLGLLLAAGFVSGPTGCFCLCFPTYSGLCGLNLTSGCQLELEAGTWQQGFKGGEGSDDGRLGLWELNQGSGRVPGWVGLPVILFVLACT